VSVSAPSPPPAGPTPAAPKPPGGVLPPRPTPGPQPAPSAAPPNASATTPPSGTTPPATDPPPSAPETSADGVAGAPEQAEGGPSLQESGQGAARAAAQRNARHIIDGDLVGRDKFVFHLDGRRRYALRQLSSMLFDRVKQAFVEPESWTQLRQDFNRRRVVVLQGEPGTGRTAAAVRLLHSAGSEAIYDLDPAVDLALLTEQLDEDRAILPEGAGLLLCQPQRDDTLRGRTLRGIEGVLAPRQRLTLIVGPDARLGDDELMQYVVTLPARPDLRRILERHIEWRLGSHAALRRLLDDEDVAELVAEMLQDVGSCEDATLLASVLCEQAVDGVDHERVRRLMSRRGLDAFDQWFDELPGNDVRSFAVALAVLDGLPYEDVARASTRLARRLASPPRPMAASAGTPPASSTETAPSAPTTSPTAGQSSAFRFPRRQLLELTRSAVDDGDVRRPYGRVPAQLVAFRDRSYPRAVIDHVWFEHQVQDAVLEWLVEVADDRSDIVRVQVATTVGVLATGSFHHVLTTVIDRWAGSRSPFHREAAAYALQVPGSDPRLEAAVRQLVRVWLGDIEGIRRRATAARALGLLVAADVEPIAEASTWFDMLAADATWTLQQEIGAAFCDLLLADSARFAPAVLERLVRWLDDPRRADTARLVFLLVAHDLVTELTTEGTAPTTWPTLLHLAKDARDQRATLVQLWCRVLGDGPHAEIAEAVLSGWADRAERDADLREAFARFLRMVGAANPRAAVILQRCARIWRGDGEALPLPQVAGLIELVLSS
jgi:hypothetical protein